MVRLTASIVLVAVVVVGLSAGRPAAQGPPDGQLTVAFDASIAPTFLDPAETPGIGMPFVFLYALHDALIKPMPGNDMAPSLATSWKEARTGSPTSSCSARASSSQRRPIHRRGREVQLPPPYGRFCVSGPVSPSRKATSTRARRPGRRMRIQRTRPLPCACGPPPTLARDSIAGT